MPDTPRLTRAEYFRQGDIPLDVRRVERHASCPMHSHDFSELVIVLRGTGLHVTPAAEHPIAAGDAFVLHGDQEHGYLNTEDLGLVNILFRIEEFGLPRADIASLAGFHVLFTLEPMYRGRDRFESRLRLNPDQLRHVTGVVEKLEREFDRREPGWAFTATAYFMLIVADLSRFYSRVEDPAVEPLLRLGRVIGHIERSYAEPLTLDDLARIGCMSRRTLTRVFRSAMGCSPIEHLLRLRVQRAAELLRETDAGVTEVALQVGFRDGNYFSRQFRAVAGTSPRAYRARQRGA